MFTIYSSHCTRELSQGSKGEGGGRCKDGNEGNKTVVINDMMLFTVNPNECIDKLLEKSLTRILDRKSLKKIDLNISAMNKTEGKKGGNDYYAQPRLAKKSEDTK